MSAALTERRGACHCRAVRFTIWLPADLAGAARCNCSICRMRGAVIAFVPLDRFQLVQGADRLSDYRFNTREARHYFCATCGIYTHHQRRADPNQYCVNLACLEGGSPFDFAELPVVDGIHHPNDRPGGRGTPMDRAGTLRFEPRPGP